jgi:dipeptidyl aminopeptidase/acylaminoacyl peptidase
VRASGERVVGDIVFPDHVEGPVPAVMLVSGSGAQDRFATVESLEGFRNHHDWTERLNAAGLAVVRYDEPGTGGSEGDWTETGLHAQKNAIANILLVARANPRIDSERLFVLGHSAGAFIAMMLSAEDPSLAGIILVAGAGMPIWEVIEYQNKRQADAFSPDPELQAQKKAELDASLMAMMRRYAEVRETTQLDAASLARMVQSPALIIHGETDYQVPPDNASRLAATMTASGIEADVVLIPEVNHLLVHDPDQHMDYSEIEDLSLDTRLTGAAIDWLRAKSGLAD